MERLNIHLTRATSAEYDDLQSAVGANPSVTYAEIAALGLTPTQREVLERQYSKVVNASATIENVVGVELEGYTISGVCNAQGTPVQPYLTVNIKGFEGRQTHGTVHAASDEADHKLKKGDDGVTILCTAAPYAAVRYERPVVVLDAGSGGLLRSTSDFEVKVHGPLGQPPLFTTLTLHFALVLDYSIKKDNRGARHVISHVDGTYGTADDRPHYARRRLR